MSLCDEGHLKSWNLNKQQMDYGGDGGGGAEICNAALEGGFVPTALAHPPTYLNKVLVGSEGGSLQLWNVRTGRYAYFIKLDWRTDPHPYPVPNYDTIHFSLRVDWVRVLSAVVGGWSSKAKKNVSCMILAACVLARAEGLLYMQVCFQNRPSGDVSFAVLVR